MRRLPNSRSGKVRGLPTPAGPLQAREARREPGTPCSPAHRSHRCAKRHAQSNQNGPAPVAAATTAQPLVFVLPWIADAMPQVLG